METLRMSQNERRRLTVMSQVHLGKLRLGEGECVVGQSLSAAFLCPLWILFGNSCGN